MLKPLVYRMRYLDFWRVNNHTKQISLGQEFWLGLIHTIWLWEWPIKYLAILKWRYQGFRAFLQLNSFHLFSCTYSSISIRFSHHAKLPIYKGDTPPTCVLRTAPFEPSVLCTALFEPSVLCTVLIEPSVLRNALCEPSVLCTALFEPCVVRTALFEPSVLCTARFWLRILHTV